MEARQTRAFYFTECVGGSPNRQTNPNQTTKKQLTMQVSIIMEKRTGGDWSFTKDSLAREGRRSGFEYMRRETETIR